MTARRFMEGMAHLNTDVWTQPFWDAAREHRLVCQRCANCGTHRMPPAPFCYRCRSQETSWTELPGTGTLYSYTVITYATAHEIDSANLPYIVGVVELDATDGCRLIANLLETATEDLHVGLSVRVRWDDFSNGVTVPRVAPE